MISMTKFGVALLSAALMSGVALAADLGKTSLPAVSAVNGKVDLGGGYADIANESKNGEFYGAGSISFPLGSMAGLQIDGAASRRFGDTSYGGGAHLFTRNPDSYLFGVIGGMSKSGDSKLAWVGGEGELYLGQVSLELQGGLVHVNPDFSSAKNKAFVRATGAFYATDNLRLELGASSVAAFETGHIGAEWLMEAMPLSLTADLTAGEDHYVSATAGVKIYFGGDNGSKSLIRRHREDDPQNTALETFGQAFPGKDTCPVFVTPTATGGGGPVEVDPCAPTPPPPSKPLGGRG